MACHRCNRLFLLSLALLFLYPVAAAAQNAGALSGQVLDDAGRPLEGVTIRVSTASRLVTGRGAVSALAGSFLVPSLPPGEDYEVLATVPGYSPVRLSEVAVIAGQITRIQITMQRDTVLQERIEVKGRRQIISLESTTTSTRFSSEFIESLPILGRNYQDILALAPGVTDVDGDGNPNIHGARDTDVITLVDGVSTTDPLTGKIGAQLNIESIQEIEVKTAGATAEFSRAQGGFANIITKSGGNDFQGTFKIFWRGAALDGDGAGSDDARLHGGFGDGQTLSSLEFNDFLPFLSLEGPIVRDRAWFFTAHEYVRVETPVNTLSSAFVTTTKEWREFAKLTWQANQNHRLALSLNYDPQELSNQGLDSLTLEESGYTIERGGPVVTLKLTSILTPLVSLDTALSRFDESPSQIPTLDPDTNRNGFTAVDWNRDGFIGASESDPGEDFDNDGAFDVFEDANGDGEITVVRERDPITGAIVVISTEDLDGDKRLTSRFSGACEGTGREDLDCDGRLDRIDEDANGNGRCDIGESCDIDHDGRLERGVEDRNENRRLDDRPFPGDPDDRGVVNENGVRTQLYPYGRLTPTAPDSQYIISQQRGTTSGPYFRGFEDDRTRLTFRQDLSIFVPDYFGSHDFKTGVVLEQEEFDRETTARSVVAPIIRRPRQGQSTVRTLVPTFTAVRNQAENTTLGVYFQDSYKPFPNLSIGFGLRFDREATDSFGYTPFDPVDERAQYDRLNNLVSGEGEGDLQNGNDDGKTTRGILADPFLESSNSATFPPVIAAIIERVKLASLSRLTRHHVETRFFSSRLQGLFPEITGGGDVTAQILQNLGVRPQRPESFRLTNNNLAPRLSISWDPWSDGRSKLFTTWGRYYDKLFLSSIIGEEGPDTINRYYHYDPAGITVSGIPNRGIGKIISQAPPTATQVDRGLGTPFSDEFTIGFEREIAPEVAFSVTYISRNYRQQLQDIDLNHSLRIDPSTGELVDAHGMSTLTGGCGVQRCPDNRPDLYINNFFFNQVLRVGNFNESSYRGIELEVVKRLSRRWEVQGSYTYSRALGAAEDFQSRLGNDPSTLESEYGYLDFDQRHVVKLNTVTFLPGDWQLGLAASWTSGLPYSIVSRFFALDNFDFQQYRTRFGFVDERLDEEGKPEEFFNTMPRNSERNHSIFDFNIRARKSLVIGKISAAIFLEVFNVLNSDDLRIFTVEPTAPEFRNPGSPTAGGDLEPENVLGPIQLDATRRFGRRFQVGFQFDF